METLHLIVTGMSCMGCVNSVSNLLRALPGVTEVRIDLATGRVETIYTPDQVGPAQLRQAILDGGYGIA